MLIPVAIGLWILTFTALSLLRQNYSTIARPCENPGRCATAPYSLLLHECRDHGRCSPAAIARGLNEMVRKRPVIERLGNPQTDYGFDPRGVVRDAVSMIETWAGGAPTVTVLIRLILATWGRRFGERSSLDVFRQVASLAAFITLSDRLRGPWRSG